MKLLVIGTVAIDSVETIYGNNFNAIGGSAVYASISASFFAKARIKGIAGTDFPNKYINILAKKGIDVSGLDIKKGKTFKWHGRYTKDLDGARTVATHLNLLAEFDPGLSREDKDCEIVLLANNDPDLQLKIISQTKSAKLIAADTMDFWIKTKPQSIKKVLKKIDILIINESEAELLTKEHNAIAGAKKIIKSGTPMVIIKKGANGLIFSTKDYMFSAPAYPLKLVYDPTGAGDSFAGGFLGYLASKKNFSLKEYKKALIYGSVMASYNVQGFDIKVLSKLNSNLIEKRYKEFEKLVRFW